MTFLNGIDISTHQKGINVAALKADFVIIKATEGQGYTDPELNSHFSKVKNKLVGFYHFARPHLSGNTAKGEADWFYSQIKDKITKSSILILDWEAEFQDEVSYALAWLKRVEELSGIKPLIYMSMSVENSYNWDSVVANGNGLWIAKYRDYAADYNYDMSNAGLNPTLKHWPFYALWQWTSVGRLDGYAGNLDCNIFYGDSVSWNKYASGGKPAMTPPIEPQPSPKPLKYGVGQPFRCLGLFTTSNPEKENAGYIPDAKLLYGKGDYYISYVYNDGRKAPYEVKVRGSDQIIGFANDWLIDNEPSLPGGYRGTRTYTVRSGETLSEIGTKLGIAWKTIANINGIRSPYVIWVGQKLKY